MEELQYLTGELTSGDDDRAEEAVRLLAARYGQEAVPLLAGLLSSEVEDTRWWAVWALAETAGEQAAPFLILALEDISMAVRQCAALALRQHPCPQAIPGLIKALGEGDPILARLAAAALAATGGEAIQALIQILENGSQANRLEAIRALALLGDPSSIPALYKALEDDSNLMEFWASEGLERMGIGMSFFSPS